MKKKRVPKYRRHKSGAAFVEFRGKQHWLGRFGTDESRQRYRRFLEQIEIVAENEAVVVPPAEIRSVTTLCDLYLDHAIKYYVDADGKQTSEYKGVAAALLELDTLLGEELAFSFGPKMLVRFQAYLVTKGYARSYVNKIVGRVKRMFRWCTQQELVRPDLYHSLVAVEGLKKGRTKAPERPKVRPVPQDVVNATLPWMSPVVADLARIQLFCGMRPGEACRMRPCEIDRSGDVWFYMPGKHKNDWRGIVRIVPIPKVAQAVLAKYLNREPESFVFSPRESEKLRNHDNSGLRASRTTKAYPYEERRRLKKKLKRSATAYTRLRHCYDRDSYRRAVTYAITKAKRSGVTIERWHPNQLRHSIATAISQKLGRQAAMLWLGHEHLETTGIYAEKQMQELTAIAQGVDCLMSAVAPTNQDVLPLPAIASSA